MTDVIEDAQVALEWTIGLLRAVLNNLRERIRRNKHRPLTRRSFVRWLAAFLPKQRDPRMFLQKSLGAPHEPGLGLQHWASTTSLQSDLSSVSVGQGHWLEEDLGGNLVQFRRVSLSDDGDDDVMFPDSSVSALVGDVLRTSTPRGYASSTCSSVADSDQASSVRMTEMEDELATLRRQIALLVMAQETSHINKTVTGEEEEESPSEVSSAAEHPLPLSPLTSHLDDSGCESEGLRGPSPPIPPLAPPPPPPLCPPPPPPLPPPSLPPPPMMILPHKDSSLKISTLSEGGSNFSDMLKDRKSKLSSASVASVASDHHKAAPTGVPDMAHVLKDLHSVTLKAVARSPGGTPMRRKPRSAAPSDPASIIAQALRKKFAAHRGHHRGHSPESDKENDSSSFCSDSSPHGQESKRIARRLSLRQDDSDSWTPLASPVKTQHH